MHTVREILPNGKPLIVDALVGDDGRVLPNTLRVFPVVLSQSGEPCIAEQLEILSTPRLVKRLVAHINNTNEVT